MPVAKRTRLPCCRRIFPSITFSEDPKHLPFLHSNPQSQLPSLQSSNSNLVLFTKGGKGRAEADLITPNQEHLILTGVTCATVCFSLFFSIHRMAQPPLGWEADGL